MDIPPPLGADPQDPVVGDAHASAKALLYMDYQCPYCRALETDGSLAGLQRDDVARGRVQIVFKQFPFLGPDSWRLAVASDHVWATQPEKWQAWNEAVFRAQGRENSGWASPEKILALSRAHGIDPEGLRAALAADDRSHAKADLEEGAAHGVSGTPTFLIGGKAYSAQDRAAVRDALDREMRAVAD